MRDGSEDLSAEDRNKLGASEASRALMLRYRMSQHDGDMVIPPHDEVVTEEALEDYQQNLLADQQRQAALESAEKKRVALQQQRDKHVRKKKKLEAKMRAQPEIEKKKAADALAKEKEAKAKKIITSQVGQVSVVRIVHCLISPRYVCSIRDLNLTYFVHSIVSM